MQVTSVTYERLSTARVGSYENERAACTVLVNEDEDPREAMAMAKYEVFKALGIADVEYGVTDRR